MDFSHLYQELQERMEGLKEGDVVRFNLHGASRSGWFVRWDTANSKDPMLIVVDKWELEYKVHPLSTRRGAVQ